MSRLSPGRHFTVKAVPTSLRRAWMRRSPVTPVASVAPPAVRSDVASVARALGAAAPATAQDASPAPVAAASRWRLLGVVAQPGQQGAALISMDGQPPRPYAVGAALDGGQSPRGSAPSRTGCASILPW